LDASTISRVLNSLVAYALTALMVVCCFLLVSSVKSWKDEETERLQKSKAVMTWKDKGVLRFITILSSLIVVIINSVMRIVVRKFSMREQHET
jgi:hypothetical protein